MEVYTQEQMDAMREALKAYKNYLNVRDMVLAGFTSPLDPAVTNYFKTVPQEVRRDLGDGLDRAVERLAGIFAMTKIVDLKSYLKLRDSLEIKPLGSDLTSYKDKRPNFYEKIADDKNRLRRESLLVNFPKKLK